MQKFNLCGNIDKIVADGIFFNGCEYLQIIPRKNNVRRKTWGAPGTFFLQKIGSKMRQRISEIAIQISQKGSQF